MAKGSRRESANLAPMSSRRRRADRPRVCWKIRHGRVSRPTTHDKRAASAFPEIERGDKPSIGGGVAGQVTRSYR